MVPPLFDSTLIEEPVVLIYNILIATIAQIFKKVVFFCPKGICMPFPLVAMAAVAAASSSSSLSVASIAAISSGTVAGGGLLTYLGYNYFKPTEIAVKEEVEQPIDNLIVELDKMEKNIKALTDVVALYQEQETSLKKELNTAQNKRHKLQRRNKKLESLITKQDQHVLHLLEKNTLNKTSLEQQITTLKTHRDITTTALDAMKADLQKIIKERDDLVQSVQTLQQFLEVEKQQKQRLYELYQTEKATNATLKRHNQSLEEENIALMEYLSQRQTVGTSMVEPFRFFSQLDGRGQENREVVDAVFSSFPANQQG